MYTRRIDGCKCEAMFTRLLTHRRATLLSAFARLLEHGQRYGSVLSGSCAAVELVSAFAILGIDLSGQSIGFILPVTGMRRARWNVAHLLLELFVRVHRKAARFFLARVWVSAVVMISDAISPCHLACLLIKFSLLIGNWLDIRCVSPRMLVG